MDDGDPLGGGSGTPAIHMTESTAGKGLLCTISLPVFLPSAFMGSQLRYWIKGPYRRFYSSKCHLKPYLTAQTRPSSKNKPLCPEASMDSPHGKANPKVCPILSCIRAVLLLELGAEEGIFKS